MSMEKSEIPGSYVDVLEKEFKEFYAKQAFLREDRRVLNDEEKDMNEFIALKNRVLKDDNFKAEELKSLVALHKVGRRYFGQFAIDDFNSLYPGSSLLRKDAYSIDVETDGLNMRNYALASPLVMDADAFKIVPLVTNI